MSCTIFGKLNLNLGLYRQIGVESNDSWFAVKSHNSKLCACYISVGSGYMTHLSFCFFFGLVFWSFNSLGQKYSTNIPLKGPCHILRKINLTLVLTTIASCDISGSPKKCVSFVVFKSVLVLLCFCHFSPYTNVFPAVVQFLVLLRASIG